MSRVVRCIDCLKNYTPKTLTLFWSWSRTQTTTNTTTTVTTTTTTTTKMAERVGKPQLHSLWRRTRSQFWIMRKGFRRRMSKLCVMWVKVPREYIARVILVRNYDELVGSSLCVSLHQHYLVVNDPFYPFYPKPPKIFPFRECEFSTLPVVCIGQKDLASNTLTLSTSEK